MQVANIGPADWNYDETLSTLRYSNRAKNIKNRPKINEDPKDTMLREVQEEIQRLREQLAKREGGGGSASEVRHQALGASHAGRQLPSFVVRTTL